jgi:TonB family protein
VLEIVVAEDGSVRQAMVIGPLDTYLDDKALDEVKKWKFEPAIKKGKPVAVRVNVEVNFSLY